MLVNQFKKLIGRKNKDCQLGKDMGDRHVGEKTESMINIEGTSVNSLKN